MSELIKELAEESRKHFGKTEKSGEFWVFDEQKFAKLIVEECLSTILNTKVPFCATTHDLSIAKGALERAGKSVAEKFNMRFDTFR